MKKDIHPQYYRVKVICSCGNVMEDVGSTSKIDLKTELCSACHPFYTGKQKFVDSRGQIEKFEKKRQQAKDIAEAKNAPKEEKQPVEKAEKKTKKKSETTKTAAKNKK